MRGLRREERKVVVRVTNRTATTVLTTHAGSLPRPVDILDALHRRNATPQRVVLPSGRLRSAVEEIVSQQVDCGIDIVGDGETSKPSFVAYAYERLSGFEERADQQRSPWWTGSKEAAAFPGYYESLRRTSDPSAVTIPRLACTGPINYTGTQLLQLDLENLRSAVQKAGADEVFVTSTSPSNIEDTQPNLHYPSQEEYLFAIASAMRHEYLAIIDSGFLLQIDDPRIATRYTMDLKSDIAQCRRWAQARVEALNYALSGIPQERVRFHTCFSIDMGPRVHEMQLRDIVDIMLRVNSGMYSFEAVNPRHEHEWQVWKDVDLPDDKALIPGFVTHSTVLVEHEELVAERIMRFASVVGRERMIAGTDCGFAAIAGAEQVHSSIVWAKLRSLVAGAKLASSRMRS